MHTQTHLSLPSMSNYYRHQYFRISVHSASVWVCVYMYRFCPKCFRLPPAALPPFTIQTAYLRACTLRRDVCCASALAWHPLPTLAQHLGGINFLPRSVLPLLFCCPARSLSLSTDPGGWQGHVSSFLSCVHAVSISCSPSLRPPFLDPIIIHTSKSFPFPQM